MKILIILELEIKGTKINHESIFYYQIVIVHNFQVDRTINKEIITTTNINQVQTTNEMTSDPPGLDKTETLEKQVNHLHCESTDGESETEAH